MIDTKLLRQKILDLAIRGKLVPQDPNDEPASELLKRIKAEKEALIKAGKMKRDKHESFIFRGEDKRYYEHVDGKETDITEEIPFDLPQGWAWCRMYNIAHRITDGEHSTPKREKEYSGYYLISARNVLNDGLDLSVVDFVSSETYAFLATRCSPQIGDVLLSCSGTVGRCCICDISNCVMVRSVALIAVRIISSLYLQYAIQSPVVQKQIQKKQKQVAQANIFQAEIKALLLPLPPLAEQKRIVAKIDNLLKNVDEINQSSESLENKLTLAKQKILDLAIRGKLVPQNPDDEPASELLRKIKIEKEALIKAGKLKRDKHESFIFKGDDNCYHEKIVGKEFDISEEIPFELPQGWEWYRLNSVFNFIDYRGKTPTKQKSGIPLITAKNVKKGFISYTPADYISPEEFQKRKSRGVSHKGDILFTTEAPLGNAALADLETFSAGQRIITLQQYTSYNILSNKLQLYFILSSYFQDLLDSKHTGSTVAGIKAERLKRMLLPLPPLAEQKRIVSQVEKVFSILETMRK